jgi:DNA-directed RNA polymerase specialized sigma24 family protein
VSTDVAESVAVAPDVDTLDFYQSLDALRAIDDRQADTLELRLVGLTIEEIAEDQGRSVATVKRDLRTARAFLAFRLGLPAEWIQP